MKMPDWLKPSLYGAGIGAIVLATVGFMWGGWTTSGGAADLARKQSLVAVTAALLPYCIERSASDPNSTTVLAEFAAATTSFSKRSIVERAGWATPLGAERPDSDLANACHLALAAAATPG